MAAALGTVAKMASIAAQTPLNTLSHHQNPEQKIFGRYNGLSCQELSSACGQGHLVNRSLVKKSVQQKQQKATRVFAMAADTETLPSLNDLPMVTYINQQGRIQPPIEKNTEASVFAIYDANKKIQYIGFSRDVRNSLRTLMGRRPQFCYFYKIYSLKRLDQQKMLDIRKHWFSELGLPPSGNSDITQRNFWEKPVDAGSISERGKAAAAQSQARTLLQMMVDRGIKEEMVYDPVLLSNGKCDLLPSQGQTEEELASARSEAAASAAKMRHAAIAAPDGEVIEFDIVFDDKIKTNGGWMFDVRVTMDDKETRHRVVCGRIYPEAVDMFEDDFLERVFAFLLHKKMPRQTEGVLTGEQFAVNYFAISEVAQKFDDFQDWFSESVLPDSYWRFNRIHSYGSNSVPDSLGALSPQRP